MEDLSLSLFLSCHPLTTFCLDNPGDFLSAVCYEWSSNIDFVVTVHSLYLSMFSSVIVIQGSGVFSSGVVVPLSRPRWSVISNENTFHGFHYPGRLHNRGGKTWSPPYTLLLKEK